MELSDRKIQILQAIIMNYLETAEPVGSRTISRRFPLGISSATIRNEMSDLEELGLIVQPHTSAGRIPSSKGYRLYVDHLLDTQQPDGEQYEALSSLFKEKYLQLDSLIKEMGDILAALTKYTAIVTMPQFRQTRIKHLQLIPLDRRSVILVVITDGNIVRNNVLATGRTWREAEMYPLSDFLNRNLEGRALEEIEPSLIERIKEAVPADPELVEHLFAAIRSTLRYAENVEIFTSGATNILNFPEFSDIARARALMDVFQEKEKMLSLVDSWLNDEDSVKVTIGTENAIEQMQDCSVVTATYRYGDRNVGSISIVGPMRMDYNRVISTLAHLVRDFRKMFEKQDGEQDPGDASE